jgi:low affinity Fe/Cu permease
VSRFDRFAAWAAKSAASARFFAFCVLLVLVWLPSLAVVPERVPPRVDTWQLLINTATTVITFLLVALLHNDQQRFEDATNRRLTAIIEAVDSLRDPVQDEAQKPDGAPA